MLVWLECHYQQLSTYIIPCAIESTFYTHASDIIMWSKVCIMIIYVYKHFHRVSTRLFTLYGLRCSLFMGCWPYLSHWTPLCSVLIYQFIVKEQWNILHTETFFTVSYCQSLVPVLFYIISHLAIVFYDLDRAVTTL